MATYQKFQSCVEAMAEGKHIFSSDQLEVALCNAAHAPVVTNTVLANLTQIAYTNLSPRLITTISSSQTSGIYSLVLDDLVLTASGNVAPFRYVVVFNQDAPNDELIAFFDYGSDFAMTTGKTFPVDFGSSLFTLT